MIHVMADVFKVCTRRFLLAVGRHLDEELPPGLEGATPVGQPSGVVGREQALASARDRPLGLFEREKDSPRAHHSPDSATGAGLMTPETPSLPDRTDVYDFLMDTFPARSAVVTFLDHRTGWMTRIGQQGS